MGYSQNQFSNYERHSEATHNQNLSNRLQWTKTQVPHRRWNKTTGNFLWIVQIILAILFSWPLPALLFNRCRKSIIMLHASNCTPLLQQLHWLPISERIKCKTSCICYNAVTGSHPPPICLNYCTVTVLPALSALRQINAYSNSNALSHTSAPTSGTISAKTSGTRLLSHPSKANSRH